jgi:hypothetical protein
MCEPVAMEILSGAVDEAMRHGASIVHRDADFEVIAAITGLKAKSFR